jgi:alpha-ketoglutarate-dependent 2,4-dichlorophenoxyacetate dioxygenase
VHHLEGIEQPESDQLIKALFGHASKPQYYLEISWENPGDLVIRDNTSVMRRAKGGSYVGKYTRDLRRTAVHGSSSTAWDMSNEWAVQVCLP